MHSRFWILLLFAFLSFSSIAQKKIIPKPKPLSTLVTSCQEITARADMDVNNVRTLILGGADMWWDLANGRYEIPKGGGVQAIFAGSLWIGALDQGGQLHVAAQTYRQTGNDFWSGPIDTVNGTTPDSACWKYDRVWKVDRFMVEEFMLRYKDPAYTIPKDILEWPGNGDQSKGEAKYLAPFIDNNADGIYNPKDGDYPAYDFSGTQNCEYNLLGDQTLWWIFNDVGGYHGETGGDSMGLEIHAQAFAYQTNDEINDATFYQYKVINRSVNTYSQMYWGQWIDSDLGCYTDDYVACDVQRGLGYCYNGDADDDVACSSPGYGLHPPAIGFDFLGGPLADVNDGVDNDRDYIIDEVGERIMMSNFLYYDGTGPMGDPYWATHFYNYLRSVWGDGIPMTYGGNGYVSGGPPCKFMFPRTSDPTGWGTGGIPQGPWDEVTAGNTPSDRKLLQSAGPFTMQPGAVQFITQGIVWARDTAGDNMAGVVAMQKADDKAQALFDGCFNTPCYPPVAQINHSANELLVFFGAYSHGTSYSWDFGDGTNSVQKFPKHTYATSGTYNVCLKVTNTCGTDSICQKITVANIAPPPWGFRLKRIEGNGNGGRMLEWLPQYYDSVLKNNRVYHPVYDYLNGPVNVAAYDTTLMPAGTFVLKFDTIGNKAKWKLYLKGTTDTVFADSSISTGYTQMIPQWGMQVKADTSINPGGKTKLNNGFLEASMEFSNTNKNWLSGLKDNDFPNYENWIRSGSITGAPNYQNDHLGVDSSEYYETMIGGTWAPYRLSSATELWSSFDPARYYTGPGFKLNLMSQVRMQDLASVDVIITSDRSKWTRCVVLDLCEDSSYSQHLSGKGARKLDFRREKSVDKFGNAGDGIVTTDPNDADYISATGMGWFPGYAVNLETGERLNICFGENSALVNENGADMIWNPTQNKYASTYNLPWDTTGQAFGSPVFGGQHYIYVFGHNKDNSTLSTPPVDTVNVPVYDAGNKIRQILGLNNDFPADVQKREIFREAMWVNIPLLAPGHSLLESDVKVRLRVMKKYSKGYSSAYMINGTTVLFSDTTPAPLNRNYPMYEFESKDFGPKSHTFVMEGYSFFPNPFSTSGTFWFENTNSDPHELQIFDIRGRVVRNYTNLTGQSCVIERGSLRSGVYFYSLSLNGARKIFGKFVIVSPE